MSMFGNNNARNESQNEDESGALQGYDLVFAKIAFSVDKEVFENFQ